MQGSEGGGEGGGTKEKRRRHFLDQRDWFPLSITKMPGSISVPKKVLWKPGPKMQKEVNLISQRVKKRGKNLGL